MALDFCYHKDHHIPGANAGPRVPKVRLLPKSLQSSAVSADLRYLASNKKPLLVYQYQPAAVSWTLDLLDSCPTS
jgi:hypothetical protein